ncbi:hypothetical protein ACFVW8_32680 [Streptomyces sp. NPDC058221]|uniref:hypothetical protein n=1 Tax=Streptomyces sp. NPDC058221 TaxID=3346388 RepID=UPI0036E7B94A
MNCHGDGDDAGGNPFTTHGQYEHDLLFDGNSGLMDIAGSGAQRGISAKRITVRGHVCSWFTANTKITDLALEDITLIARPTFDQAGTLTVNAGGSQVRGCTAKTLAVAPRPDRSTRPTTVSDCTFEPPAGAENAAHLSVGSADLRIDGGTLLNTGVELSAVRDQRITVTGGTRITGSNKAKVLLGRAGGALHLVPDALDSVLHTACVADGTRRSAIPEDGERVRTDGNLTL